MAFVLYGHFVKQYNMKELKLKSFEFASDLTKQLITLSTVLIGLSITFFEKFKNDSSEYLIITSWALLFASILFGIFALMAITGHLGKPTTEDEANQINIYSKNITIFSILQIFTFIGGILLLIIYSSNSSFEKENSSKGEIIIIRETKYKIQNNTKIDTLTCVKINK